METDRVFQGSVPALYDEHLGPMLFAPYAADIASRLAHLRHGTVLETASGTGVVTRALAATLPEPVRIEATDLNQAMLDQAATRLASPRVTWRQADAQALPFDDASFDAVICQFGVMFFPDQPRAFAEAHRVLKPGGIFLFNVWDRIETNDFADIVSRTIARLFPDDPPRFIARTPHGHHDTAPLRAHLLAAGFTTVEAEQVTLQSHAPNPLAVATGICQGTPLRGEIESRDPSRLAEATTAAATAIAARFGTGAMMGQMQAHVVTAVR